MLIPLFRNMGEFAQVLDNHGANEKGTDIILVEKSKWGGFNYTSVIVKAVTISNATSTSKDRETAANVSQQIALAIHSGHHCNLSGKKVDFNQILLVTNQSISNTARETFIGNTVELFRFTNLRFLEAEDLLNYIDDYLSEFYFYRSGRHARIASALQRKSERLNELQNLPKFTVEEKSLVDVFVKPKLRRLESRQVAGRRKGQIIVKSTEQIISQNNRVLIIGEAGAGKSIILREAVLSILSENTREATAKIPILVKAHDLAKYSDSKLVDILNMVVRDYYDLDDFNFETELEHSEIILLIDGLDEIVELQRREDLKNTIVAFGNDNPNIKIVVTSRRTQDITAFSSMPSYQYWEVLPFNFVQVREFVSKWFTTREESGEKLLTVLKDHQLLSRLPSTPLVLTLLAILFDSDEYREVPANLAELYQMFLDLLLGKWNLDRRAETMYNANIREYLATEIALKMHQERTLSITPEKFGEIVVQAAKQRGIDIDPSVLLDDFTEQTALMVPNDKNDLEFRHLSFQEFLYGLAVYRQHNSKETIQFLIQNFEDSWWTNVLYFYCGLRQDTPQILSEIINRLPDLELRKRIVTIFELGYLVQAAYLTPIQVRMESVEAAIREFYICVNSSDDLGIDEQVPEGILYFALVFFMSVRFSSRMLQDFYSRAFEEIKQTDELDPESSFLLLSYAIFVAHNGNYGPLAELEGYLKKDAKQLFALKMIGEFFDEHLSPEEKRSPDYKLFRKTLNKVRKWFRESPDITKYLLTNKPGKPSD